MEKSPAKSKDPAMTTCVSASESSAASANDAERQPVEVSTELEMATFSNCSRARGPFKPINQADFGGL